MSTVSIKNNTSNNIAFEARVLTLQGQHSTVRASLLAGSTTDVPLPNGITPEMLAESPEVKSEQSKASPNWSIVGVSSDAVGGLSDYETLRRFQPGPASATISLGCVGRNSKLTKIRVSSTGPSGAGESYTVTDLLVNGVSVSLPVAQQCVLPQNTLAYTDVSSTLSGSWTQVKEGDFISAVISYVAGAATLAEMSVEVTASKA